MLAKQILRWQLGLDELARDEVECLRVRWESRLLPALSEDHVDELWKNIIGGIQR